jgi:hypothetical protein
MQAFLRAVFLAVIATGLTACQYVNDISTNIGLPFVGGSCVGKSKDKLRGVEWDKARVVEFRIRQGHFDPMLVQLSQNEPYVFRFVNRDEYEHIFRAPEFFNSIAIEKVSSSGKDIQQPCMIGVGVPPEKIVEVQFVADRDGRYEFQDSELGFPTLFSAGNGGIVYISLPRTQIQSPFNLQVVEPPAPVAPAPAPASLPSGLSIN